MGGSLVMKSTTKFVAALLAVGIIGVLPARAEGDAAAGKKVFNKCMACHDAVNARIRSPVPARRGRPQRRVRGELLRK